MSTRRTQYVVYGISIPKEFLDDEKYEEVYDDFNDHRDNEYKREFDPENIYIIDDPMNGDYFVVGYILAKGIENDGGIDFLEIDPRQYPKELQHYSICQMIEKCPFITMDVDIPVFLKFYAFTQWS